MRYHLNICCDILYFKLNGIYAINKITKELFSEKDIIHIAECEIKGLKHFDVSFREFFGRLDYFNFPIVNFSFIYINIPAAPAHEVSISQLIRYSRACDPYNYFSDRLLLLTRKLLNQGFLLAMVKSSY
jgi:hypothetical protein